MCGIAGYVGKGKPSLAMKYAFFVMASEMDDRGGHSWGWTNWERIEKGLKDVRDGLEPEHFTDASAAVHTRFGTTGDKIAANSHPFHITAESPNNYGVKSPELKDESPSEIIGMHNGIVYNHTELNRDYGRKCEVDSMHIFHHILNDIPLNTIEAYGAILYKKDGELYGGKFNGGELTVALTKEGLIYASTKFAVDRALDLSGIELVHYYEVKQGELYRFAPDNLYIEGKIDIAESLYSHKWNDSKYTQDKWWEKEAYGYSSGGSEAGSVYTDWEKDIERIDQEDHEADVRAGISDEPEYMEDLSDYDECEMCGIYQDNGDLLFNKDDNALVCHGCAFEMYGHVSPGMYEVTSRVRFTCEDCKFNHTETSVTSKYRLKGSGLVVCGKCFWKNYHDKTLVKVSSYKSLLIPTKTEETISV